MFDPRTWGISQIIGGLLSVAAIVFAAWFFVIRPANMKTATIVAHGAQVQAEASLGAAKDNLQIVVRNGETIRRIDNITETASNDILASPGASDQIDPSLHAAGIRALCLHDGRSNDPVCAELLLGDGSVSGPR